MNIVTKIEMAGFWVYFFLNVLTFSAHSLKLRIPFLVVTLLYMFVMVATVVLMMYKIIMYN